MPCPCKHAEDCGSGLHPAELETGVRVRLLRDVVRFPYYTVSQGALGTVTYCSTGMVVVLLDQPIKGRTERTVSWWGKLLDDLTGDLEIVTD